MLYDFEYARICDNNHLDSATVTVSASGGFPFSNALDLKNRNTEFRPASKSTTIQIDLGANKRVSFFALLGASDSNFGLGDDAVVTLKGNMINLFTGGEAFNETVSVSELGCYTSLSSESNPYGPELRYWQIVIDDSLNPNTTALNYVYLGDHIQFIHNVETGFQFSVSDFSTVRQSNTGKTFSVRRPQGRRLSGTGVSFIRSADRRTLLNSIQTLGTHSPFLFVLDPEQKQLDHDFAVTPVYFDNGPPALAHVRLDYFNVSFNLRECL